ncbi:MAG: hypothetical protein DMG64_05105 [Acidobacteria bacterium]|nr:MAG: hypothetical protein DMG64_05105 [Acidobacteriota bacterium]PYY24113.1 MAG: hypothetical protein DMG62_05200 [Acidobacteriota bacterium]
MKVFPGTKSTETATQLPSLKRFRQKPVLSGGATTLHLPFGQDPRVGRALILNAGTHCASSFMECEVYLRMKNQAHRIRDFDIGSQAQ